MTLTQICANEALSAINSHVLVEGLKGHVCRHYWLLEEFPGQAYIHLHVHNRAVDNMLSISTACDVNQCRASLVINDLVITRV